MKQLGISYRVCGEEKDSYYLLDEEGRILRAELRGKFRVEEMLWPSVGDYVLGTRQPGDWVVINSVVNRRNALRRRGPGKRKEQVFATNVDLSFIVTSANDDLNEKRLDRYMAMALDCDTLPIIVVNKIELVENPGEILESLRERFIGFDVLGVSVYKNINMERIRELLPHKTAVFVGSSGVGKSSLVNALLGSEVNAISEIREDDDKGRHTTTSRSLHRTANGGVIIDTPGIRGLSLLEADAGITEVFSDIDQLARQCRFRDCQHKTEPGCLIREALVNEVLDESRWESYQKLERENSFVEAKHNKRVFHERKKQIAKDMKLYKKVKQERQRR